MHNAAVRGQRADLPDEARTMVELPARVAAPEAA